MIQLDLQFESLLSSWEILFGFSQKNLLKGPVFVNGLKCLYCLGRVCDAVLEQHWTDVGEYHLVMILFDEERLFVLDIHYIPRLALYIKFLCCAVLEQDFVVSVQNDQALFQVV